ncbi:MAG TPA: plastocyanin/azurin family copper-binding protein [Candidatus Limnocylindrales bacterium]|nr:plastocyanin/azurin family copper-binding protein [Candidatus Limnocylindrales bacterium]
MSHRLILGGAAMAAAILGVGLAVRGIGGGATYEIDIRYSHYQPASLTVPVGVPITFVLHNDDPIDHEWIVGTAVVHAFHRASDELLHTGLPTEVSIPAMSTVTTTITFRTPDRLQYICHLPGHEAYGMTGWLTIAG